MDAIRQALAMIRKQDLIFETWGLAERHRGTAGLAFHFAGPPGTGKTIAAEAIAATLGRRLLVVRYAELESRWVGQTQKHVAAVFRDAVKADAVLFFDEADAIAARRFTGLSQGYEREANAVVNVLLNEVERFPGVVIFATNLAANLDPAFERRIRTHIRFDLPGPVEREKIWRAQLHATKTPLAADVDFKALADRYPRSGGDIKNAVLKAAQLATFEPGPDSGKVIHQRHFVTGMEDVMGAQGVMAQSLYEAGNVPAQVAATERQILLVSVGALVTAIAALVVALLR
jgi:SpoVK/Ycf46/Vps4 family AAA+-type ATPase